MLQDFDEKSEKPFVPNLSKKSEVDLHELSAQVCDTENYLQSLQDKKIRLQNSIKNATKHVSEKERALAKVQCTEDNMVSKCKENLVQFRESSASLKQDYLKLQKLVCEKDADPLLLFQLPFDSFKADKSTFEGHIKSFIIRQFEEVGGRVHLEYTVKP